MFYLCYLYVFTYTCVQHDFHFRWCSCRLTITQRVSHLDQELLTLPRYLSSPPVRSGVHVARSLVFYVMFCRSSLSFFHRSLDCLLFFDLRRLITYLVSSNFSFRVYYRNSLICISRLLTVELAENNDKTNFLNKKKLHIFQDKLNLKWNPFW